VPWIEFIGVAGHEMKIIKIDQESEKVGSKLKGLGARVEETAVQL